MTVEQLLGEIGLDPRKVAVERNLEIVPKSNYAGISLDDGDRLEIVHFIGGGAPDEAKARKPQSLSDDDTWEVAGRRFKSRLIIGTGKYEDYQVNRLAAEAAGSEIITVAIRRVNLDDPSKPLLVDYLDPKKYTYLPNTAGCFTTDDALRTLRLAREAGGWDLVKLEILGEERTLYPMMPETLEATETLTKEGFQVMVYCSDDPIMCKRLEDVGDYFRGRGLGNNHRRHPARQPGRSVEAAAGRLPGPEEVHIPAQHRRLLHHRRRAAHAAPGPRGRRLGPGEAGDPGRGADPLSDDAGNP